MMKKIIVRCVAATSLLSATFAFAHDPVYMEDMSFPKDDQMTLNSYQSSAYFQNEQRKKWAYDSKSGFTIGLNGGWGKVDAFTKTNNAGFAWNANVGYQFNPYFAVESGYTAFADVNESGTFNGSPYTATDKYYGVDVVFKPIWPLTTHFNLFGKIGAMYFTALRDMKTGGPLKHCVTQYNPEVGIGMSYDFNHYVAVSAQAVGTFYGFTTYAGYGGLIFKF
jgi:hypothetical protein